MQQTEGETDCSSLPHVLGQRLIGHIAINLQDTRIVGQLRRDLTFAATVIPLGLVISSFATIMICAAAAPDVRWRETSNVANSKVASIPCAP